MTPKRGFSPGFFKGLPDNYKTLDGMTIGATFDIRDDAD